MFTLTLFLFNAFANADPMPTVYSCKEQKIAVFEWSEGGMLSKPSVTGKIDEQGGKKEPATITLVVSGKKAMFKGNGGDASLETIDGQTFLERTSMGNIFMWKLIPGVDKTPTLLVQFKAYEMMGPYIHAWVFKCS